MANDTVIVVGVTRKDEWDNLWVTPQGDGDEVKIAAKRSKLHPLFEQGKAVMLHWETYMDKPYVSTAKLVEGELPAPQLGDKVLPEHQQVIDKAKAEVTKPAPQEVGMWYKEMGNRIGDGSIERDFPKSFVEIKSAYYKKMAEVTKVKFHSSKNKEE